MLSLCHMRSSVPKIINRIRYTIINHTLDYGQRGVLNFCLLNRTYDFTLQTMWQDHCQIEIQGLTTANKYLIYEQGQNAYLDDSLLNENKGQRIRLLFRLPLHYGLLGKVNGSINHIANNISPELQSENYDIQVVGEGHSLSLGKVLAEKFRAVNQNGLIHIKGLTCSDGIISCKDFKANKVMSPGNMNIDSRDTVDVRSMIFTGYNADRLIKSKNIAVDTLNGQTKLHSDQVKVKHLYAGENQIDIFCGEINCSVGEGTGKIQYKQRLFLSEEDVRQNIMLSGKKETTLRIDKNVVYIE